MATEIMDGFSYRGKNPNFDRDSFKTLADMKNVKDGYMDEGHISFCEATGKHYVFKSSNDVDEELGKWRLFDNDISDQLDTKVDKDDGKGLSTNDFTNEYKAKLDNLDDMLYPLLNPYSEPQVSLSLNKTLFEVGTTNDVIATANITKGRDAIQSVEFKAGSAVVETVASDVSTGGKFTHTESLSATTKISVVVSDGTKTITKEATATFVNKSYYGTVSADTTVDNSVVANLNSILLTSKSYTYNNITGDNINVVYAYPKSYGTLSKILDANGFDYISSYDKSEITIDGVSYYCYVTSDPATLSSFKQVYS